MNVSSRRRASVFFKLLFLGICHFPAFSWGAEGSLLWQNRLDLANGFDQVNSTASANHLVFVAGAVTNAARNTDWHVRALDARTGAVRWQDQFDSTGRNDAAQAVVVHGGLVFVSGYVTTARGDRDLLLRAYELQSGRLRWESQYDRAGKRDEPDPHNLTVKDGRLLVGGRTAQANGTADWFVRAYDSMTGVPLWQDVLDGGNFDHNVSLTIDSGRVYASGVTTDAGIVRHFTVRTYDAGTGAVLWQDQVPTGNRGFFFVTDVAWQVAARGRRVVAVGSVGDGSDNMRFVVRTYQAETGVLLWSDVVDSGAGNDAAFGVAISDHGVFVAGSGGSACSSIAASNCNWIVRAYNLDSGRLRWKREFDRSGGDDQPTDIIAIDDRVVVAGIGEAGFDQGSYDWVVQTYSARSGTLVWEDIVKVPGGEGHPLSLSTRGGRLFVGGWVFDAVGSGDALLRAHDLKGHGDSEDDDD
jgi:glucose dehydrogenase